MFSLAAGLFYLGYQLARVGYQIPAVLDRIGQVSTKVDPVVQEIGKVSDLVPPILAEIEQTRKLVPDVIQESREYRKLVPDILQESKAYRKQLPAVLESANQASAAVSEAANQIEATRPLVPKVLKEVETTRESLPALLDRADQIVANAGKAGQEASQGAVTGVFTGILLAPFKLLGGVGKTVLGTGSKRDPFTDKDYELVEAAIQEVLAQATSGTSRQWKNADSGHYGSVTDTTPSQPASSECRTLETVTYKKKEVISRNPAEFCRDETGTWTHKE